MEDGIWRLFYQSDLQGVYGLLVVPALFLAYLAFAPGVRRAAGASRDAHFVWLYSVVFCIETLLDPIATGPVLELLDLGSGAASAVMVCFVILGDLRVFLLVFQLLDPERRVGRSLAFAALASLFVPIVAYSGNALVEWFRPELTGQRLWLIYELSFLAVALFLRNTLVPRRASDPRLGRFLRACLTYVAAYYALWASADVLILFAKLDAGWLLRVLPNQLYYAFWIPFVWMSFDTRR